MPTDLKNKVAFITGAAHGQGRATAVALAKEGVHIVALDIAKQLKYPGYPLGSEDELETLKKEIDATGVNCIIHKGEIWLKSLHIAEYSHGTVNNHDPVRDRKLLLQKREINKIEGKLKEKGYTLIPLRIFFNEKNLIKVEIGLGKGKKLHDKRETIKNRDVEREMKRFIK